MGALLAMLLAFAALAAGCSGAAGSPDPSGTTVRAETEIAASMVGPAAPESTTGVQREGEVPSAADDTAGRFSTAQRASGGKGYGADSLLAVRYGHHEGYERVVLDLGTGREPAQSVPEWSLVSPEGDGLLRVELPSLSTTTVSDGDLGGILERFYVVRSPEGGLFVDVFARRDFSYRVLELEDPARLVVDFRPTGAALEAPLPRAGGNTVLVEPRRGERVSEPLTVRGYSRNPEATNTVLLSCPGDGAVARRAVRSNDWAATWGYFEATLDLASFEGRCTLRVGAESARDGSFEGVAVPVLGGP